MPDFTRDIAQAIAAAKATRGSQFNNVRQGPVSVIPGNSVGGYEPFGEAGEGMGRGLGTWLGVMIARKLHETDSEVVGERADRLAESLNDPSQVQPELRDTFIRQEAIQSKLKEWQKIRPDKFFVHEDGTVDILRGVPTTEERLQVEEAKKPLKETLGVRAAEANIAETEETAGLRGAQTQVANAQVGLIGAQKGKTAAETTAIEGEEQRANEIFPEEKRNLQADTTLKLAKAQYYLAGRDKTLSDTPVDEDIKHLMKWRRESDDALMNKLATGYIDLTKDPAQYTLEDLALTRSLVTQLEPQFVGVDVGEGQTRMIPKALMHPGAMMWVNKSIDDAYLSMATNHENMTPAQRQEVFTEAVQLYNQTYLFEEQDPAIAQFTQQLNTQMGVPSSDQMAAHKIAIMEYFANYDTWTPEEAKKRREQLIASGASDLLLPPPGGRDQGFSFFGFTLKQDTEAGM